MSIKSYRNRKIDVYVFFFFFNNEEQHWNRKQLKQDVNKKKDTFDKDLSTS